MPATGYATLICCCRTIWIDLWTAFLISPPGWFPSVVMKRKLRALFH
jgi:hypothetical protein